MATQRPLLHVLAGGTGAILLSLSCSAAHAQQSSAFVTVNASEQDVSAASQAQNVKHHARPATTPAGRSTRPSEISNMHPADAAPAAPAAPDAGGARYPADLQYHGGPVVTSMQQHLIYVNLGSSKSCSTVATCWGNPQGFLSDYGQSDMIHIVDQYTGSTENNRYTVSHHGIKVNYPLSTHPYTDNDMLAIVHAVVTAREELATGYDNQYHIFLVPGQDECFDSTYRVCYSPDIPASFAFCAYHGSADFTDIGHVLYSVEPFANVPGCDARPNGPNGPLADSTNNTLSHEVTETITDPDGTAWWIQLDNGLFGEEIGDECSFLLFTPTAVYFDPSNATLNGRNYALQPEYDNAQHACTTAP